MNEKDFRRLVARVIDRIPGEFTRYISHLAFVVEMWADDETLAEFGFDDPRDLLGFYSGTPVDERDAGGIVVSPDAIILYQGAIEACAAESGDPLMTVIRETIVHEIAHHFGFSEDEMDAIEALWLNQRDSSDFA